MKNWISALVLAILAIATQAQTTCVDPLACNFTELGECEFLDDNGMPCVTEGCAIPGACNFNPEADINDGSCEFTSCLGCTDEAACNYDPEAVYLDLSCIYFVDCNGVCGGDWIEDECGNCYELVSGEGGSAEFSFTGAEQTFVVPVGVSALQIECWGASGGDGHYGSLEQPGGRGGYAAGTLLVTSGQVLSLFVGGEGTTSNVSPVAGGFNGGGDAYNYGNTSWNCAGGGGATDVRVAGSSLDNRVLVAGGGGGGGGSGSWGYGGGGDGGGLNGFEGYDTEYNPSDPPPSGRHGKGGSQTAGGLGGTSQTPYNDGYGSDGSLGNGGDASTGNNALASGGGGGYYGGGGGSYHGGGGGGGSSYVGGVTDATTISGVNSGDGYIVISWEVQTQPLCVLGCSIEQACNFNPEATNDDGSCDFCFCGPGTEYDLELGQCMIVNGSPDINGDGCTNLNDLLDLLSGYGTCED